MRLNTPVICLPFCLRPTTREALKSEENILCNSVNNCLLIVLFLLASQFIDVPKKTTRAQGGSWGDESFVKWVWVIQVSLCKDLKRHLHWFKFLLDNYWSDEDWKLICTCFKLVGTLSLYNWRKIENDLLITIQTDGFNCKWISSIL